MAKGSEPAITWKTWKGPRECDVCGIRLTIEQVGEHRTYVDEEGRVTKRVIWCVDHRGGRE